MSTQKLEILIGADVKGAVKGVQETTRALNTLPAAAAKAGASLQTLGKSSGSATAALGNLGRVAQDAPFGFIGIANNLNPLLESFQRLRVEAGSNKAALSALAGSLTGAGGIGLALSAVTAIISFAQMGLRAWGIENEDAADKAGKTAKTTEYVMSTFEKAEKAAKDFTSQLVEQKKAYKLLTESVFTFTDSIAKEAEIKALIPQVQEFTKKIIEAKIALNKLQRLPVNKPGDDFLFGISPEELASETKRLNDIIRGNVRNIETARAALTSFAGGTSQLFEILGEKAEKSKKDIKDVTDSIETLRTLTGVTDLSGAGGVFTIRAELDKEKTEQAFKDLKEVVKQNIAFQEGIIIPVKIRSNVSAQLSADIQSAIDSATAAAKLKIIDLTSTLKNLSIEAVTAIGEGIGNALAGTENPFAPLISVIANGLKAIGKLYIQTGIEMLAAQKALNAIANNPYLTIVAGIALTALGQLAQSLLSKQTKFAEGGIVSGPTNALIGEAGQSEVVMPLSRLSGILGNSNNTGKVVFEISGQKLIGVLNRGIASQNRTFG